MDMKKPWEIGRLKVSNNQRYLQNGETPFFWLGDTAWLLFCNMSLEETYVYLKNRKEKGYNVIQATLVHTKDQQTIDGALALHNNEFGSVYLESGYWEHVEEVIKMAEELGLYMGLLPSWGSFVKNDILNKDNVVSYTEYLVNRYKKYPNIIWIAGGDVRGDANPEVVKLMGQTIKKLDAERLVCFHPFGRTSSSLWFHEEEWLDFNMFQSGHRSYDQQFLGEWDDNIAKETFFGEDNYRYVIRDHENSVIKPTVDAEPSYEQIPHGLHDETQPYWQASDVRRYAYWSVFAGAMGHTYGSNSIMQFYRDITKKGAYGVKEVWQDAIHHVGSSHMMHMKDLMESVNYFDGVPAQDLLEGDKKEKYERVSVFAGEDYLFAYSYLGETFTVNTANFGDKTLMAYWFDPTSGVYSFFGRFKNQKKITCTPIQRTIDGNDWVLVLRTEK